MPLAMLKLDIKKAFDTVSWSFMMQVMAHISFPDVWMAWVGNSVLQGTSQVLINGLLGKKITLKRGVRQGDPLSPALFIVAMDFLARYLQKLIATGAIRLPYEGMRPCLLYADDALLFLKPDSNQARTIKIGLLVFQEISGLAVNLQKSEIITVNVQSQQQDQLAEILDCKIARLPFTYLGIPLSDKRLPKTAFLPLIHKFNSRLGGWAAKFLSIAGRLVLLNSVLSSLPIYMMSVLKLPQWVINAIDKIRRRFLWHGANDQQKGYNLVDWEVVCEPKQIGGLGVLDLKTFNYALLMKWQWDWFATEHRLWKPLLLRTAPISDGLPFTCIFSQVPMQMRQFFICSTQWNPGDGQLIMLWDHDWGQGQLRYILPNLYSFSMEANISLQSAIGEQNLEHLFRHNPSIEAQEEFSTLQTKLLGVNLTQGVRDEIKWKWTAGGTFTVKSAYTYLKTKPRITTLISKIWNTKAPPRIKIFAWLAARNRILTHDNLQKRGWTLVSRCLMCHKEVETTRHLFQECPYTQEIYEKLRLCRPTQNWPAKPTIRVFDRGIVGNLQHGQKSAMLIMLFVIWRERCARCFTDNRKHMEELLMEIKWQLKFYETSQRQTANTANTGATAIREE